MYFPHLKLLPVRQEQLQTIESLVNRSYRGESGWTRETELLQGDRVGLPELQALLAAPTAHLLGASEQERLVASICITLEKNDAHIGLFAVDPALQGKGLGRRVLQLAEAYAWQLPRIERVLMQVISQRPELLAYYERRGYQRSGKVEPFPQHLPVGTPRIEGLTVETLYKLRKQASG